MNLLSLSYGELAEQLGISVKSTRPKERRFEWSGLTGGRRVSPESTVAPGTDQPQPAARTTTVLAPRNPAPEQMNRLEARIATLTGQMAALQEELGRAERLALAEQYNVVQERKKAAELRAEVHRLTAILRDLQQAGQDRPQPAWWKRLLAPHSR